MKANIININGLDVTVEDPRLENYRTAEQQDAIDAAKQAKVGLSVESGKLCVTFNTEE